MFSVQPFFGIDNSSQHARARHPFPTKAKEFDFLTNLPICLGGHAIGLTKTCIFAARNWPTCQKSLNCSNGTKIAGWMQPVKKIV
jgi:hypothetical protein